MRIQSIRSRRVLVMIAGIGLLTAAIGAAPAAAQDDKAGEPVVVCELAYYTGEFQSYGPSLTNDVRFPIEEVINLDPPLGRTWELDLRGHRGQLRRPGSQDLHRAARCRDRGEHRAPVPYLP